MLNLFRQKPFLSVHAGSGHLHICTGSPESDKEMSTKFSHAASALSVKLIY